MARPQGWTAESRGGVIRLRAPGLGVAIVTAPRRTPPSRVMGDLLGGLRSPARRVEVVDRSPSPLGDVGARAQRLRVIGRDGRRSEVLVLAARSRWRTYGVTVFSAVAAPLSTSTAVAAILDSFEFSRPR